MKLLRLSRTQPPLTPAVRLTTQIAAASPTTTTMHSVHCTHKCTHTTLAYKYASVAYMLTLANTNILAQTQTSYLLNNATLCPVSE